MYSAEPIYLYSKLNLVGDDFNMYLECADVTIGKTIDKPVRPYYCLRMGNATAG